MTPVPAKPTPPIKPTVHPDPTAPSATKVSAAERLLERRLAIVARLDVRSQFEELAVLDTDLDGLNRAKIAMTEEIVHSKANLEDAELMAVLSVEGKNETERKLAKATAIRDDLNCQQCAVILRSHTQREAECDVEIDSTRRRIKRLEMLIQNKTAYLQCLAG